MIRLLQTLLLLTCLTFPAVLVAQTGADQPALHTHEGKWVCPMQCEGLTFDKAGSCPVCHMDLVASAPEPEWVCPMQCEGLKFDKAGSCPVCHMDLVSNAPEPGGFFDDAALLEDAEAFDRPETALMPGLSTTHAYGGALLAVLLVLFLGLRLKPPTENMTKTSKRWTYPRWDLTRGLMGRFVKWRGFQFALQVPVMAVFVLVVAAGLFGNQDPSANIAPVLTWNIWWMGLVFFAFFAGEVWCTVCPWMALPDWLSRGLGFLLKTGRPLGRHAPWPKYGRTLYPAIVLFLAVTWLEIAYEAPYRPMLTALMALGMVAMATITLFAYERKGFCRYLCPVGRVTGAYGLTGMVEIRRRDTDVCHQCKTKDCLNGNDKGLPCPTREYMGAMNENMYCTMCTECVRTCPHENVAINVRPPFIDLMGPHRKRVDEAWLLLVIVAVSIFHGLAMVPFWTQDTLPPIREYMHQNWGWDPGYLSVFSATMALFLFVFVAVYWLWAKLTVLLTQNPSLTTREVFVGFAYGLVPMALGYHLAHNALHFFYEGSKLVRLVSDPFGWGWDLLGTRNSPLTMLIPMEILWIGQIVLTLAGLIASVVIIRRTAHRMISDPKQAKRVILAASLLALILTLFCIWLLNQPMEMRTA